MAPTHFYDDFVIEWTIYIRYQFPFVSRYFTYSRSDHRYLCIPSLTSLPISTLYSFLWYVIPCKPVTCLQDNWMTFHREGPKYIYPSYGWTNPTLDPCVSTNTFRTLNATFIATQLRCGVWCHQSILPVMVICMISWSKELGYYVSESI